jgi:hypothetical protein
MKKSFILLTIAIALSACNATRITQTWVKDNCTEQHKLNPQGESFVYVKCENLHPTDKIKKVCPKSKACYSPSEAVIEIEAACGDSTFNIAKIVKAITNR